MSAKILRGPSLKCAIPKKSLGQMFFDEATKNSEKVCQVDGTVDSTETYASVKTRSTRVAIELEKRGVKSTDVVAFCCGNTLDTVIPMLATFYLGAKVANLERNLSVRQTQHLISLVTPKLIFTEENSINLIETSLKEANLEAEIIVYGWSAKYTTLKDLSKPQQNEESFRPSGVDLNEVAIIFFSSGTTGLPKAICHSHNTFMRIGCALKEYDTGLGLFHYTSFYWITANFMLIASFLKGGSRVFLRSIDPEATLKAVEKYKVTTMFLAPIIINKLALRDDPKKYDTTSLRLIILGGTQMSSLQYQKLSLMFEHSDIVLAYGMTETGMSSGFHPELHKDLIRKKPLSCGLPFYDTDVKIVDIESEEILGANQKGEIRLLTPMVFTRYYSSDASDVFDKDNFLKTGDVGYYDEDGCLYVMERLKEMFKYQSWHIIPSAIEAILIQHPAVKEAVVFGKPCGDDGEAPAACVVLEDGADIKEKEIEEFIARNVSDKEKLRGGVIFVTSLLKTPTGKFMRKEIRDSIINS